MTFTNRDSRIDHLQRDFGKQIKLPVGKIQRLKTKFERVLEAILPQNATTGEVIAWCTRVDGRLVGPNMLWFLETTGSADDRGLATHLYGTSTRLRRFHVRKKLEMLEKVQLVAPYRPDSGKYLLLPQGKKAAEAGRRFLTGLLIITRERVRTLQKKYAVYNGHDFGEHREIPTEEKDTEPTNSRNDELGMRS
ncbi:MAG: hypothetical protein RBG13Loki_3886 [Promethearchaeota archaeon CR_4]|nr:MAG: hypothetical protein RBG13Loki_3886 [Candidatus Lokiarchaeota archaeon CR_4]